MSHAVGLSANGSPRTGSAETSGDFLRDEGAALAGSSELLSDLGWRLADASLKNVANGPLFAQGAAFQLASRSPLLVESDKPRGEAPRYFSLEETKMPTSDPQEILIRHNEWSTQQLLTACEPLAEQQLHAPFEMGLGSLYASLLHILGAMQSWGDLLAGREPRPRLEREALSLTEMRQQLGELTAEYLQGVQDHASSELITSERNGRSYTFSRGAIVTHVMTHGMHHRAQCLNMLRQLGIETLPPSAIVEWTMLADPAGRSVSDPVD